MAEALRRPLTSNSDYDDDDDDDDDDIAREAEAEAGFKGGMSRDGGEGGEGGGGGGVLMTADGRGWSVDEADLRMDRKTPFEGETAGETAGVRDGEKVAGRAGETTREVGRGQGVVAMAAVAAMVV